MRAMKRQDHETHLLGLILRGNQVMWASTGSSRLHAQAWQAGGHGKREGKARGGREMSGGVTNSQQRSKKHAESGGQEWE